MIKRIVRMDMLPDAEVAFLEIYSRSREAIRAQKGCMGLDLLRSVRDGHVSLWTISMWQSVDDLETYRSSALFRNTWTAVKPLFSGRAEAWTLTVIDSQP